MAKMRGRRDRAGDCGSHTATRTTLDKHCTLQCASNCVVRCTLNCALNCMFNCTSSCVVGCALKCASRRMSNCAVRCSQCFAICALNRGAVWCGAMHWHTQCGAVRCNAVQCGAARTPKRCTALLGGALRGPRRGAVQSGTTRRMLCCVPLLLERPHLRISTCSGMLCSITQLLLHPHIRVSPCSSMLCCVMQPLLCPHLRQKHQHPGAAPPAVYLQQLPLRAPLNLFAWLSAVLRHAAAAQLHGPYSNQRTDGFFHYGSRPQASPAGAVSKQATDPT
ncbi:hypothetical protein VOLCADRAFT_94000 [Volvox carteri f. nagariensis]|uniref:Uncharacterized protein n=1 Tax=Volvox carteri f. nagariensis TaxID=3068 RepID=D8U3N0_VOLCA|nr:uncharacterized protein VOLCADRAFT_94000 [Volvox carteri f. nagariensis]EFJ45638.1 hypothetical protein VOLCADRAFT_94000 [Volvox carteri f. nagariensis]|eukprot:XP_002953328.1 hypothetical protein VOLCADRAFT_94000 [Volvox carteri f. nagariensis]